MAVLYFVCLPKLIILRRSTAVIFRNEILKDQQGDTDPKLRNKVRHSASLTVMRSS